MNRNLSLVAIVLLLTGALVMGAWLWEALANRSVYNEWLVPGVALMMAGTMSVRKSETAA